MDKYLERFKGEEYRDFYKLQEAFRKKLSKVPPTMEYVRNLILDAKLLFRIVSDPNFDLSEEAKQDFTAALWYFIEEKDRIPDWVPLLGLWDDYKVIKYVKEKHKEEIERYFKETKFFIANYF
ncbi:MAG: DUF1232 domain-containing protein [Aquifex sp.]|nr:MAG: DUF1232 domain-containing protein [Aquifex sp.]